MPADLANSSTVKKELQVFNLDVLNHSDFPASPCLLYNKQFHRILYSAIFPYFNRTVPCFRYGIQGTQYLIFYLKQADFCRFLSKSGKIVCVPNFKISSFSYFSFLSIVSCYKTILFKFYSLS